MFHQPDSYTESSTLSRLSSYAESIANRHISSAEFPKISHQHLCKSKKPIPNLPKSSPLLSHQSSFGEFSWCGYSPLYTEAGCSISNTYRRSPVLSQHPSSVGIPMLNRQASYTEIETRSTMASLGAGSPMSVRYANMHEDSYFPRTSDGRMVIPTSTSIGFEREVASTVSNKLARCFYNPRNKPLGYEEARGDFFARLGRQNFPDANFVSTIEGRSPKRRHMSRLEREGAVDVGMAMAAAIDGASPKKLMVDRRDGKRGFMRSFSDRE